MLRAEILAMFSELRGMLWGYEGKGRLEPRSDLDSKYDTWSIEDVEIAGQGLKAGAGRRVPHSHRSSIPRVPAC